MSRSVDERIVEMRFDNQQFERGIKSTLGTLDKLKQSLKLDGAAKGLADIDKAAKNVSLDGIAAGVESLQKRFSTFGIVGMRVISNLTDSAMRFARNTVGFVTNGIISGGKRRAMNIENAHFQLQGLLKDEEKVQAVMDDAMESVDGTAYAYDEAAKAASQFAASGMEAGEQMQSSLRAITGVAAMTNSEYESISQIFTTVAGNGRLMGDQLLQLSSRGLNAAATLADYMTKVGDGAQVTESQVREMVSDGEISFALFAAAMDDAFGEHAKKANETFSGSMANVRASLARIGAEFVSPLIVQNGPLVQFFNTLRERINDVKASIGPLASLFVDSVTAMADSATKFLEKLDVKAPFEKFQAFSDKAVDGTAWARFAKEADVNMGAFRKALKETASDHGIAIDSMIESEGSFAETLKHGWLTTDLITETLSKFTGETKRATVNLEELEQAANAVIQGSFGDGEERIKALTEAGYDYAAVQDYVNHILLGTELSIEQVSDAQLENAGYTDEQIQTLRALAEQAGKTGTPLNELMESMNKPSGRELLIDSFRNVLGSIGRILGAVRKAWIEVFPPMTSEQLYGIVESLHTFSTYLAMSDETADKLKRTLKGLFAVLNIILTITGGAFRFALQVACELLRLIDVDILSVTAAVGDAVTAFMDWIKEHNFLAKCLETLVSWLKTGVSAIRNWVSEFWALPGVQKNISSLQNAWKDFFGGIPRYFGGGIKRIGEFIDRLKSMDSLTFDNVKKAVSDFKKNVIGYFLDGEGIFTGLKNTVRKVKDDILSHLEKTGSGFLAFGKKIGEVLSDLKSMLSENFWSIVTVAFGMGLLLVIRKIANALKAVTSPVAAFTNLLNSGAKALDSYSKKLKADALLSIAKAIAVLAGSIAVLSLLDQGKVWSSVAALGVLGAGLLVFSKLLGKIGKIEKVSSSMLGLSSGIFILVKTMKSMESLDSDLIGRNLAILVVLGLGLTAFAGILSKIAPQLSKGGLFLLSFATSVKLLTGALQKLSDLEIKNPQETTGLLLSMIAGLALVAAACKKVKAGSAVTLIAIAASLHILIGALNKITGFDALEVRSRMDDLAGIFQMFALLMAASHFAGNNAAKMGTAILAMSAALILVIQAINMIADVDPASLEQASGTIAKILLIFGEITALSMFAGENAAKAGRMLLSMSGAILVLSGVMVLLSKLDPSGLARALGAVISLEAVFGALIFVTKFAKDCKSTLIILSATIAVLVASLGALSMIKPERLLAASASLSMVMGVLSLVIAMTAKLKEIENVKKVALELGALTAVVGALAGILYLLSGVSAESALGAAASLSMIMLSLSKCMSTLGEIENVDKSVLVALGVMTGVVAGLALIIGVLASCEVGSTLEIAASLSILLLALSKSMSIIGEVESVGTSALVALGVMTAVVAGLALIIGVLASCNVGPTLEIAASLSILLLALSKCMSTLGGVEKVDKSALVALGVMTAVVAGLALIIGVLASFNVGPTLEIATSLSVLITALSGACTVLSQVGVIGAGAFVAVGALITLIAAVGGLMAAIGALVTYIPEVNEWLDAGIPVLEKIGSGIGNFIGNIAGGVIAGALSGLPDIGGQLSSLLENFGTFFDDVKNIDADSMKGVKSLAEIILILTAADVLNGLTSWFTGGSSIADFGSDIAKFGKAVKKYGDNVKGISENAADIEKSAAAGKLLAEMAAALPNSGGLLGEIFGENDMDKFGDQLSGFGTALVGFSVIVKNVDTDAVEKAVPAAASLAEMAKSIPNSGGLLATFTGDNNMDEFGTQLTSFGWSLWNFSMKVKSMDGDAIASAVPAGKALAEMAKSIPNSGGLLATFTGDNEMDKFGFQLACFGVGLKNFSDNVSDLDIDDIKTAANAGGILSKMAESIPKSGGLFSIFTGDNNMAIFAEQLVWFGRGLKDFNTNVSNININDIKEAASAGKILADMANKIPESGGLFSVFAGDKNMAAFGSQLKGFGEGLADYYDAVKDMKGCCEVILQTADAAMNLNDLAVAVADITGNPLTTFGEDLKAFGEALAQYYSDTSSIDADKLTSVTDGVKKLANLATSEMLKGFSEGVASNQTSIDTAFKTAAGAGLTAIQNECEKFKEKGNDVIENFVKGINEKSEKVRTAISNILSAAIGVIAQKYEAFYKAGSNVVNKFVDGIEENAYKADDAAAAMMKSAQEAAGDTSGGQTSGAASAGAKVSEDFASGIKSKADEAAKAAKEAAGGAVESAMNTLGEHSPSKIFYEIGAYVVDGFVNGIDFNREKAGKSAEKLAEVGVKTAKEVAKSLKDSDSIFSEFVEKTEENGNGVEATLEQAAEAFQAFRDSVKDSIKDATGIFDEFTVETGESGKKLIENMQSQIAGITEWAANIQLLAARGLNKGLLKALTDMGPSGAKYVNAIIAMTGKELKKLNKAYKQRMSLNGKTADEIAASFLEGGKKAAEAFTKGLHTLSRSDDGDVERDSMESVSVSMLKAPEYAIGAYQKLIDQFMPQAREASVVGFKMMQDASKIITDYGKKLYEESEYYEEDTKKITEHKKELTKLKKERKSLNKQLKKAQKSKKKDSKERVETLEAELEANKQAIAEAKKQVAEDEEEIAEHTAEVFNNLRDSLKESMASFLDPLKTSLDMGIDWFKKFESNSDLYEADKKKLEEHQKSLKELEETQKKIQDEIDSYSDDNALSSRLRVKELTEQLTEVEKSIEETKENIKQAEDDMASHSQVTVDSILESMESRINGEKKLRENLELLSQRGISQGLLEKLQNMDMDGFDYVEQFLKMTDEELQRANSLYSQSESFTSQTLLDGFKDTIATAENWAQDMEILTERGLHQDLLERLGEMGVDGHKYVRAFLNMTTDELEEFNTLYEKSLEMPETISDSLIASFAYAGIEPTLTTFFKGCGENSEADNAGTSLGNRMLQGIQTVLSKEAGEETSRELIAGLNAGLQSGASEVSQTATAVAFNAYSAAKTALGIRSPSKKFAELGRYAEDGFSQGMLSKEKGVSQTASDIMQRTLQKLADVIDFGLDAEPVICPVLDLTEIQNGTRAIGDMIDGYALSGSYDLTNAAARSMSRRQGGSEDVTLNAVNKLQKTLEEFLDRPNIEQNNNFAITGSNPKEIANEVSHMLQQQVERRSAVWA